MPPVIDEAGDGPLLIEQVYGQNAQQPKLTVTAKKRQKRTWTKVDSHHIVGGVGGTHNEV